MEGYIYPHSSININYLVGIDEGSLKEGIRQQILNVCKECGCIGNKEQATQFSMEKALQLRHFSLISGKISQNGTFKIPTQWQNEGNANLSSFKKIEKLNQHIVKEGRAVVDILKTDDALDNAARNLRNFGYRAHQARKIINDLHELSHTSSNKRTNNIESFDIIFNNEFSTDDNANENNLIEDPSILTYLSNRFFRPLTICEQINDIYPVRIQVTVNQYISRHFAALRQKLLQAPGTLHVSKNREFCPQDLPTPPLSFRLTKAGDVWVLLSTISGTAENSSSVSHAFSPTLNIIGVKKSIDYEQAKNNLETNDSPYIVPIYDVCKLDGKQITNDFGIYPKYSLISRKLEGSLDEYFSKFDMIRWDTIRQRTFANSSCLFIDTWVKLVKENGYIHSDAMGCNVLYTTTAPNSINPITFSFIDCDELDPVYRLSKEQLSNLDSVLISSPRQKSAICLALYSFMNVAAERKGVGAGQIFFKEYLEKFVSIVFKDKILTLDQFFDNGLLRDDCSFHDMIDFIYDQPLSEILKRLEEFVAVIKA